MMDYSIFLDYTNMYKKHILVANFRLDNETVLETLKNNSIFIAGHSYKVPKNDLIDLIKDNVLPCIVELELERIEL